MHASHTVRVCPQVRLFVDLLQADIVLASPLGIVTRLQEARGDKEEGPADFLSSIEIAMVRTLDC